MLVLRGHADGDSGANETIVHALYPGILLFHISHFSQRLYLIVGRSGIGVTGPRFLTDSTFAAHVPCGTML